VSEQDRHFRGARLKFTLDVEQIVVLCTAVGVMIIAYGVFNLMAWVFEWSWKGRGRKRWTEAMYS
jgi:hypothetical protein